MTRSQVIDTIGEDRIDAFDWWMQGQTVGIDEAGQPDYYEEDVERFVQGLPTLD